MAAVHGHHGPTLGFSLLRAGFWVGLEAWLCVGYWKGTFIVASGRPGSKSYHSVDYLLCARSHTSWSRKINSCLPCNSPPCSKIPIPILLLEPLKRGEVQLLAQGHTASNERTKECLIAWAWGGVSLVESLFASLSRDHVGHRLLKKGQN